MECLMKQLRNFEENWTFSKSKALGIDLNRVNTSIRDFLREFSLD